MTKKMKDSFSITRTVQLTHKNLVYFLSTALSGCDWAEIDWDNDLWKSIPEDKKTGNCIEDKIADLLLNEHKFTIVDIEENNIKYNSHKIGLTEIVEGCESHNGQKWAERVFLTGDYDYYDANNLLQVIVFGEVVYG